MTSRSEPWGQGGTRTPHHRETELKYRLEGREPYERLCRELGMPESDERQVNHYFQSPDGGIPGESGVIRIRLEREAAVFTVKLGGPMQYVLSAAFPPCPASR